VGDRKNGAAPPIVKVTYLDPQFEFDEGDATEPCIATVVGFRLPERFPGHVTVASEKTINGWRALTHVPEAIVVSVKEVK
jgi:hypothetical protein